MKQVMLGLALVLGVGATAAAQLHGLGRIHGICTDEGGGALDGVTVTARLPGSSGAIDGTTDPKGEWVLGGMARGDWDVTFEKAGYAPRKAKVSLTVELARMPPIAVTLKKQ